MRAVCESCGAVQPADWAAGDRCTSCGEPVRREQRCHWCARYTPAGRFCRSCGAETVADAHYAAARMLKAAGVDQFSIVERLASFDAGRIEHLTRLYQRQAALVARRVDDLAWVESHLVGSGWARELDDRLTALLPIDEADVESVLGHPEPPIDLRADDRVGAPMGRTDDDVARMRRLAASDEDPTATLAAVALVRCAWWSGPSEVTAAESALADPDRRIADEAALAFGHWRARFAARELVPRRRLVAALGECTNRVEADLALALLGEGPPVDRAQLADADPDRAFTAALALVDVERLRPALRDPDRRRAAALVLATAGHAGALTGALSSIGSLGDDTLAEVLDELHRHREPYPVLRNELWTVARGADAAARRAASLLVTIGRPEDAIPLLELDDSMSAVQDVIQRMPIEGPDLVEACRWLVDRGRFAPSQYGVSTLAETGRIPDDFIPSVWSRAADDTQRADLLRVAEEQLLARRDERLHAFVLGVVFAPHGSVSAKVREDAWWSLLRWYGREEYASKGPLVLAVEPIERFFADGVPGFVERFLGVLLDPSTDEHLTLAECLGDLLRYSPEEGLPGLVGADALPVGGQASGSAAGPVQLPVAERLIAGVATLLGDVSRRQGLRGDAVRFLEQLARAVPALRDRCLATLAPHGRGDLEFDVTTTMERMREGR